MSRHFVAIMLVCLSSLFSFAHAQSSEQRRIKVEQLVAEMQEEIIKEALSRKVPAPKVDAVAKSLGLDVNVVALKDSPLGMAVYSRGIIIVDAVLDNESEAAIAFVLAHEYAHHKKDHWKHTLSRALAISQEKDIHEPTQILQLISLAYDKKLAHKNEYEADAFAKELTLSKGLWHAATVDALFERYMAADESPTHPASHARMVAIGARAK